ncbi:hypothetical protein SANTM175S_08984 [Streptomyces antimycoticus]
MASAASGTLTRKIQRHPSSPSRVARPANTPPTSGPTTLEPANTAVM